MKIKMINNSNFLHRFSTGLKFVLLAAMVIPCRLLAQEAVTLHIGDAAPALSYAKWIQGAPPITRIDDNKIYVFEFWATWCGPCIQAMPHLSELSKKYAGKISFVGVDVWENSHDFDKKNPQESFLPKVVEFVKGQKKLGRLTYNVIADNNAEDMGNKWLKAAGEEGIPCSFVIDKGRIAWIGHPYYIDSILSAVVAGTFDVEATKKKIADQKEQGVKMTAKITEGQQLYKGAMDAKDFDKALVLIDTAIARYPDFTYRFAEDKWNILEDHYGDDSTIAYGQRLGKDHFLSQLVVLWLYDDKRMQSQRLKEFAIQATKNIDPEGKNFRIWNFLADFQARAGHYKDAAASERKAAEAAKNDMTAKNSDGAVTQIDIDGFLKKAAEYDKTAQEN